MLPLRSSELLLLLLLTLPRLSDRDETPTFDGRRDSRTCDGMLSMQRLCVAEAINRLRGMSRPDRPATCRQVSPLV